jgi:hypothetical protein
MTTHKTVNDYIPLAKSMPAEAFVQRYNHPFLFGREVLEEEFRFSTLVTEESSVDLRPKGRSAGPIAVGMGAGAGARAAPSAGAPSGAAASPGSDTLRIRHWVILVKKPPAAPAQDRIFLGRSETNDICVPHKTVSKLHAYFVRDATTGAAANALAKWQVIDTGSANGTKHNGMRIPPRAKVTLVDGDTICFGRCLFQWMTARSLYDRLLAMPA